jgi:hypothetical protein
MKQFNNKMKEIWPLERNEDGDNKNRKISRTIRKNKK